jgi:hypothetical protein
MTQKTMMPDWEAIGTLNNQPQVWAYPFDKHNVPADKNVFLVQRDRRACATLVIGDMVSVARPADKEGQKAFSLGIYKAQLTENGMLTPAGQTYSKEWAVHALNAYGMVRWAMSGNHDRKQRDIDYTGPAQP